MSFVCLFHFYSHANETRYFTTIWWYVWRSASSSRAKIVSWVIRELCAYVSNIYTWVGNEQTISVCTFVDYRGRSIDHEPKTRHPDYPHKIGVLTVWRFSANLSIHENLQVWTRDWSTDAYLGKQQVRELNIQVESHTVLGFHDQRQHWWCDLSH